jgi:hypothetical protein
MRPYDGRAVLQNSHMIKPFPTRLLPIGLAEIASPAIESEGEDDSFSPLIGVNDIR